MKIATARRTRCRPVRCVYAVIALRYAGVEFHLLRRHCGLHCGAIAWSLAGSGFTGSTHTWHLRHAHIDFTLCIRRLFGTHIERIRFGSLYIIESCSPFGDIKTPVELHRRRHHERQASGIGHSCHTCTQSERIEQELPHHHALVAPGKHLGNLLYKQIQRPVVVQIVGTERTQILKQRLVIGGIQRLESCRNSLFIYPRKGYGMVKPVAHVIVYPIEIDALTPHSSGIQRLLTAGLRGRSGRFAAKRRYSGRRQFIALHRQEIELDGVFLRTHTLSGQQRREQQRKNGLSESFHDLIIL